MTTYAISQLADKGQIRAYLMTDPDYAAYALGDLEPPYAEHATWIGAVWAGEIEGLALVYDKLDPCVLFLMGEPPALSALLLHGVGPDRMYFNAKPEVRRFLDDFYALDDVQPMHRMCVTARTFKPSRAAAMDTPSTPIRLDASQAQDILSLHQQAARVDNRNPYDIVFIPEMVPGGYYYGVYQKRRLIAVAGTHLIVRAAGVAAVGNVVVHPDERGRGLGTFISEVVTQALLKDGFSRIILNVRQDNVAAIRIYQKLGYQIKCDFIEGLATRR